MIGASSHMKDMFYYYDNDLSPDMPAPPPLPPRGLESASNTAFILDVAGSTIGVEVRYGMPFCLYLNLLHSYGKELQSLIANSKTHIELYSLRGSLALAKDFNTSEIFDTYTNDLVLYFTQDDAKQLNRESYKIRIALVDGEETNTLFDTSDGLLIIR